MASLFAMVAGFALATVIAKFIGKSSLAIALLWGAAVAVTILATWLRYSNAKQRIRQERLDRGDSE